MSLKLPKSTVEKRFLKLSRHEKFIYEPIEKILDTVISWEPLMSVRCAKRKLKVAEIPGDEPKREVGDRKFNLFKWGATYLFQFIREIYYWK